MRDLLLVVHPFLTLLVLVAAMASTIIAIRVLRTTKHLLRLSEKIKRSLRRQQSAR
jgi:hypothetical protein